MKHDRIPKRNLRIVEMHQRGVRPSDIAGRYRMTTRMVRLILASAGRDAAEPDRYMGLDVENEWTVDSEDRRRELIIQRAARGARAQLNALAEASTGISDFTPCPRGPLEAIES